MDRPTIPAPGHDAHTSSRIVKSYAVLLALAWTLAVIASISWNWYHEQEGARESALVDAQAQFTKDLIYRRWNAGHGGVYVPITEDNQPNPYLADIPHRDEETIDGVKLTLVNPAYMTRQVHELGWETDGIRGHITSLKPIRPQNAPDSWERAALERFEQGESEYSQVTEINGEKFMRYMGALVTEQACLKCHAHQGYQAGDIRGGISVSVPLASYRDIAHRHLSTIGISHVTLWLLGLTGLGLGLNGILRQVHRREQAERALQDSAAQAKRLQTIQQTVGTLAHEINNPLTGVIANLQLVMEMQGKDAPCHDCLREAEVAALRIRDTVSKLGSIQKAASRPYLGDREIIDLREDS